MKSKRLSIAAAMEQLDEEAAAAAAATPEEPTEPVEEELDIPVPEDTVETAVGEMDMAESEADQADEAIDSAEGDLGTLNAVADKMEATDETGGIDAASASIVEVAVEALYQKLSINRSKAFLSMESFGSTSSRKKATAVAVENIREQSKGIGNAILVMIQKAWEFIKSFFEKVFTAAGRVTERANKLKEALAKISGTAGAETIDGSGFGSKLVYAYKDGINAADIVKGLGKVEGAGLKLIEERSMVNAESLLQFGSMLSGSSSEFAEKIAPQFDFTSLTILKDAADYEAATEGFVHYAITDEDGLLGGNSIVVLAPEVAPKTFEEVTNAVKNVKVITKNQLSDKQLEADTYAKVPTLTIEECNAIVDAVLKAGAEIEALKANEKKLNEAGAKLRSLLSGDVFVSLIDKNVSGEQLEREAIAYFGTVRSAIKTLTSVASQPLLFLGKSTVTSASAALQYVALSAKTYSVGAAEEKPAEATETPAEPAEAPAAA